MQLPETCVSLHDLTPCPKEFIENQFFEVAVSLKPYYNPVNLEKAGTGVKQKEFIRHIGGTQAAAHVAHQRSGAPRGHFFLRFARLGSLGPRLAASHASTLPTFFPCSKPPAIIRALCAQISEKSWRPRPACAWSCWPG